ncbi:MAG: 3-phosphoshikimate 1-carboxyvinyltransferase [Blastocatellia bacterium]
MKISPANRLKGEISLPGDKSISHRAAMISSMAEGTGRIMNFATSADCASTIKCLRLLGVEIEQRGKTVTVKGRGKQGFRKPSDLLDCGNSGTTMRLLAGILSGQEFESVLTGDESLSKRPMKRIVAPIESMGGSVESEDGHAPITIKGGRTLSGVTHDLEIPSAQVKSCILLAGLNAKGTTSVLERTPSRDHTERMLKAFGAKIDRSAKSEGTLIEVSGDSVLRATDLRIPGDISSAAFFLVAAACLNGSNLSIINVGLNPTRTAVLDVLKSFGAEIEITNRREAAGEPTGNLKVRGRDKLENRVGSNVIRGDIIANLIDEVPILAVFGTQIEGGIEIRDAAELRVKESDRIESVVENLRRMNASVEEFSDGFKVNRSKLTGAVIDSFGDHRIAMAFAIAGLMAEGETKILNADCAAVSFPDFFKTLESVCE